MSAIDQAMLKVFHRQSAPEPRGAMSPQGAATVPAGRNRIRADLAHDASHESQSIWAGAVPYPHADFAPLREALHSFSISTEAVPSVATPAETQDIPRAAFEVARFDWPELVDTLIGTAAGDLIAFGQELAAISETGRSSVLITGCRRGEGRTTLALVLARLLSASGRRVVLVEADFANPCLAQRLGVSPECGWQDLLIADKPLSDSLIESVEDHVTLLPLAAPILDIRSHDRTGRVLDTLQMLRRSFDVVCLDAPPLAGGRAAWLPALAAGVERAVVVRDTRVSEPEECEAVGRRLAQAGLGSFDIVENFIRV